MSTPFGQLNKLLEQLGNITTGEFQAMLSSGYFPLLRKAVKEGVPLPPKDDFSQFLGLEKLYPNLTELTGIVIPENATIASLKEAGKYDLQTDEAMQYITDEYFKVTAFGSRPLCLAHFNKVMYSQYVEEVAKKKMSCKVALLEDLLAVGAHPKYRELQRQFPIIALGSSTIADGGRCVPCLDRWGDERCLGLGWYSGEWPACCRFLLVKNDASLAV